MFIFGGIYVCEKHTMRMTIKQRQPHKTVVVCIHRFLSPLMQMVKLEASLAASNSREDSLRGELADTARREGATKERHMRELAEVR